MRKLLMGVNILVMVLALAATQSLGAGQEQMGGQDDTISGGQQGQASTAIAEQMIGKDVENQQGQAFGRVFALASKDDQIVYILVAKIGNAGELTPIPFNAAHFDPKTNVVVLSDVADSQLAQAPAITLDELQRLNDPDFERQVHSYYGQESGSGTERSGQTMQPDSMGTQQQ